MTTNINIILQDLLSEGIVIDEQVNRLREKGFKEDLIIKTLIKIGFLTTDTLVEFIAKNIESGVYSLSVIDKHEYINEKMC
ncbi:hypothetical protein SMGD1_2017 [Sulfurimonas gotlandica GD1]|uniref:Uncharacterized protein n=1 Tax=Sulfurimonas gotlandica (strain DSM 19862 / JCM 16533 / GD1) TaxID=929558 RepID=H1FWW4_SULGG|nr:hypothetical protein [Sulfurimonas gotlandica]EHP30540.1 hypothetical protein SMGD1_2017 [Sulfurimonas gotlandica GD1]